MGEKTSSTDVQRGRLDERENRLNGNITVIFPHYLHSIVDTVRDRFGFIQRLFSVPCFLKKKQMYANLCLQTLFGRFGVGRRVRGCRTQTLSPLDPLSRFTNFAFLCNFAIIFYRVCLENIKTDREISCLLSTFLENICIGFLNRSEPQL